MAPKHHEYRFSAADTGHKFWRLISYRYRFPARHRASLVPCCSFVWSFPWNLFNISCHSGSPSPPIAEPVGLRGIKGVVAQVPCHKSNTLVCICSKHQRQPSESHAGSLRLSVSVSVCVCSATIVVIPCRSIRCLCLGSASYVLFNWHHSLTSLIASIRSCFFCLGCSCPSSGLTFIASASSFLCIPVSGPAAFHL